MMYAVRSRLGLILRPQGRESTAKRSILRSLGGSRRGDCQEHGGYATEVLRFVVSAGHGRRGVEGVRLSCREGLRATGPSARRPATEVAGRLPTTGSRGAVNDGRAERAAESRPANPDQDEWTDCRR